MPELRKHVINHVLHLGELLALEEAGEQSLGITLTEDGAIRADPRGLFSSALHYAMAHLIEGINNAQEREEGDTVPTVFGVSYAATLAGDIGEEETQIIIWTYKAAAKDLIESGNLDLETFTIVPEPWDGDGITEKFEEHIGKLIMDSATKPFNSPE